MRSLRGLVTALVVAACVVAAAVPSTAQAPPPTTTTSTSGDLPSGFTDGIPVGGASGPEETTPPSNDPGSSDRTTRAVTQRYFGSDPWHAIEASAAATSRPCSLSDAGLTALVVSPVFKESSAATSPSTAPAPMTLSRYDEWSGVNNTNTNANANYGLYAFRDPNTAYKRAYWHPGIGIWQYDTAGVGAPFTAIERMDVRTVSADVAAGMAARYCASTSTDGLKRRYAAWSPWGNPCTLCEQEFQAMTGGSKPFANIHLVSGISVTGGAKARTCTLAGVAGTLRCWYIDPSVDTIEGATGWATVNPDGGSPTVAPAPLSKPFYVLERNGREERHWLRRDTGYRIDISGSRQIGKNDRPRSNQAGSGITWNSSSSLCDLATGAGACLPQPPPGSTGIHLTSTAVNGSFRPIALDAQGDRKGDVLWYAPGSTRDYLWSGTGSGAFTATVVNIGGRYSDVLPLDIDGDGDDDLLFYDRSTGGSYLWKANGNGTWGATKLSRPKGLQPLVVDTDGNQRDEVFWYGRGSAPDSFTSWSNGVAVTRSQSVSGTFAPFTGDFDGDGRTDVFWYVPGSTTDHVWYGSGLGTHRDVAVAVEGLYRPLVGDYDGDRADDIVWYAPGSAADGIWYGRVGQRSFVRASTVVAGSYQPIVADLEGDGRTDIVWYAPGGAADRWWRWSASRVISSQVPVLSGAQQAVVGGFSTGGTDGVFWYGPGATPDGVWWH